MELYISYSDNLDLSVKFVTFYNSLLDPALSDKEIRLVACLVLYNIKYIEDGVKDKETRLELINTKKTKEAIKQELNIATSQELENYLSKIKKKDVFNSGLFSKITKLQDIETFNIKYIKKHDSIPSTHRQDNQESSREEQHIPETSLPDVQLPIIRDEEEDEGARDHHFA